MFLVTCFIAPSCQCLALLHHLEDGKGRGNLVEFRQGRVFMHRDMGACSWSALEIRPQDRGTLFGRNFCSEDLFTTTPVDHCSSSLTVIFERATARGELGAGVDPQLVLETVIGPIYLRLLLTGEPLEQPIIEQIVDLVLDGMR